MASGLSFITANPATTALRAGEVRGEQRRANDLAAQSQQRNLEWEGNVDTAIRGGITDSSAAAPAAAPVAPQPAQAPAPVLGAGMDPHAQAGLQREAAGMGMAPAAAPAAAQPGARPSPTGAVQQRLAATPGGGRMALQMQQQQDQQETQVLHLLSNPATAHIGYAQAQKIGMNIPEQLAQNTSFWQGASIAKQLYPNDTAAAQKFTSAYVQTGGQDIQASTQAGMTAAGVPVKQRRYGVAQGDQGLVFYDVADPSHQVNGPTKTTGQYLTGQDGTVNFLPTGQTQVKPITGADGSPFKGQKFGAGAGGTDVYTKKYNAWLAAHPDDNAGALSYASGKTVLGGAQLQNLASQIAAREFAGSFGVKPEVKQKRIAEILQSLMEGGGNAAPTITNVPTPTPGTPQPRPAAPTAAPAPRAAPAQNYNDGQTSGTFTGQFEGNAPVYQTQDGRRFVVE